jgi:uncharacterized membrane protein
MNRITAILLAMAALLVHILVLHRNGLGAFGEPYDSAHAAFNLGRNLVHHGQAWWSFDAATGTGIGGLGSYPSPLLIWISAFVEAVSAFLEGVYFPVTRSVQVIGISCALGTVFMSTRFDTERNVGVIPALLLVFSGAVAAAGASGTEWPIAMFLTAMAFVTLEHGRPRFASVSLMGLVLATPAGTIAAVTLAIQTLIRKLAYRRRNARQSDSVAPAVRASARRNVPVREAPSLLVFVPAGIALFLVDRSGASLLPHLSFALQFDAEVIQHGFERLRDFVVTTASPVLLIVPLIAMLLGELSAVGRRAFWLSISMATATVLMGGGDPESFGIAFVPALGMSFIAIQQGMTRALDTYRRSMERGAWILIVLTILISLVASRFPGNLGQIRLERVQEKLYAASATPPVGGSSLLGRSALFNEIRLTERLREVGSFLRLRLPEGSTVMTPWPGALGYLSRRPVLDLFGRTTPLPGKRLTPWSRNSPAVDIEGALAQEPDYILPTAKKIAEIPKGQLVGMLPVQLLEGQGRSIEELRSAVSGRLARYDLVVTTRPLEKIPLNAPRGSRVRPVEPLVLFRKRGIQSAPRLTAVERGDFLEVRLGFDRPPQEPSDETDGEERRVRALVQLFDADISLRTEEGTAILLDPTGARVAGGMGRRRSISGMVIDPDWIRPVTIARISKEALSPQEGEARAVYLEGRVYHHTMGPTGGPMGAAPQNQAGTSPSAVAAAPLSFTL